MKKRDKGWRFKTNELKYVSEVLSSGFGATETGAFTEKLELEFAKKHNQEYAIGCNSGTSTLHTALEAFGVGYGDEVIIPALTCAMCGYAVTHANATPVYADVCKDTFLISPEDIKKKITTKTKAIMVVHLYGLMCNMEEIEKIAKDNGLYLLEDCAQTFLATDHRNILAGTAGDVGSWSFENSKHLSCGDGGIVTTNNPILAEYMRQFAHVGFKNITATSGKVRISRDKFQDPEWKRHNIIAYNYRLPEICAAVALSQVEKIDFLCDLRHRMGISYLEVVNEIGFDILIPQKTPENYKNSYYTFAALFNGKKYGFKWQEFRSKYLEFGGDGIYAAWQLVYDEPCFKNSKTGWGRAPVAEDLQKNMMQFTCNQANQEEIEEQMDCLRKTLNYFKKLC
jgi:perosamine synthetase